MPIADQRLIFIGGGGFARECFDWANNSKEGLVPFGYLDDAGETQLSAPPYSLSYLGAITDYVPEQKDRFVFAIGSPSLKEKLSHLISNSFNFVNLTHVSATVSPSAKLGKGAVICPFALISSSTNIGDFVTINAYSSIGHDSKVGDFSTLSGHVDLTGNCRVGKGVFWGSGSRALPNSIVEDYAVVGACSQVIKRLKTNVTLYAPFSKKL